MDHTMINEFVGGAVAFLILALSSIAWFAVKRWVSHVDALAQGMTDLKDAIGELKSEFVTQTQHSRDLSELRRRTNCDSTECPYRDA